MLNSGVIIMDAVRGIFFSFAGIIYELIIWLYDIFLLLCNSRLLDTDVIKEISQRVGLILGIVMLFIVVLSAIQMMLDPDKVNDKEKGVGNIIKKIIIVIVMLGLSNSVFSALYGAQKLLIESNIIGNFLLPNNVGIKPESFGGILSGEMFGAFYRIEEDSEQYQKYKDGYETKNCVAYRNELIENIKNYKRFGTDSNDVCLNDAYGNFNDAVSTDYIVNFNWFLSVVVGLFIAYFILNYCLSVGIRTIQLAFLEIISPMAIISYLSPKKETMFEKWWKVYFSTYIDVFIRIMIINLIIFLIGTILETGDDGVFWASIGEVDFWTKTLINVFMIISLLMFAKKAPDLLKKIFPSIGDSGLSFGTNNGAGAVLGMGAALGAFGLNTLGRGVNMVSKATKNWDSSKPFNENINNLKKSLANKENLKKAGKTIAGGIGGLGLGVAAALYTGGTKGYSAKDPLAAIKGAGSAQAAANKKYNQRMASGVTFGEKISDEVKGALGIDTAYQAIDKQLKATGGVTDAIDNSASVKKLKEMREQTYKESATAKANAAIELDLTKSNILSGAGFTNFEQLSQKAQIEKEIDKLLSLDTSNFSGDQMKAYTEQVNNLQEKFDKMGGAKNAVDLLSQYEAAEQTYNAKLSAIEKTIRAAGDSLKAGQEATLAISTDNKERIVELYKEGLLDIEKVNFEYDQNGEIDIEKTDWKEAKYYVSGIGINKQTPVNVAYERAQKTSSETDGFTTYKEFDDHKIELLGKLAEVEMRKGKD